MTDFDGMDAIEATAAGEAAEQRMQRLSVMLPVGYETPEKRPGAWSRYTPIVTARDAIRNARAEATAAAEQRLRAELAAKVRAIYPRANASDGAPESWRAAVLALLDSDAPAPRETLRDHETCVPHDHAEPDADRWDRDQAAPPPASPRQGEPVDVERLARALHEAEVCLNWSPGYGYLDEHNEFHDDHGPAEHTEAARIVAAYAALSEPAEASEP